MSKKSRTMCLKQATAPERWWECSSNDEEHLKELLEKCKKSGKSEKVEYQNVNGDKIVLEGNPSTGILWANVTKEPAKKRIIIPVEVPHHEGFQREKDAKKSSKSSRRVSGRVRSKKRRTVYSKKSHKKKMI